MNFADAKQAILLLLKSRGKATNREMIRALGGDAELFAEVRESLVLDDLARDKDGAGLVNVVSPPAATRPAEAGAPVESPAVPPQSRHRLFMSYGRKDAAALASRLKNDLEKHAYEVWQDTQRLIAGKLWEHEIRDSLAGSALVVALLTPHATRRSDVSRRPEDSDSVCLDEISYARFSQPPKPIVPVMAATCEPPFCIFRLEYVDLCAWQKSESQYQAGLKRLLEAIEAALRGEVRYRSWVQQMKPWDFGAFLNEKRQHFSGRQWLFEEIDAWRASDQERALLIAGDPGIGKSAVVAELVHRNPGGQVLAYHCCQSDTPATLQPGLFVRSLAAMIASKLPAYAAALADPMVEESAQREQLRQGRGQRLRRRHPEPARGAAAPGGGRALHPGRCPGRGADAGRGARPDHHRRCPRVPAGTASRLAPSRRHDAQGAFGSRPPSGLAGEGTECRRPTQHGGH